MSTDFNYGGKQIVVGGPIKPGGKDMPSDARTRVETYADIASIPNPHVGLKITVKVDETNNNKMTDYIVKSLKANSAGIANTLIDEVVRYVDYLGVNTSGSSGEGLTSEQLSNIAKIPAIKATVDALPNNYASKNHTHSEYASSSHRHDASEIDNLPSGGVGSGEGLTTEQAQQLQTAYQHSQSDHVTMDEVNAAISNAQLGGGEVDTTSFATDLSLVGSSLQLKNSNGALIGSSVLLPSSTGETTGTNEVNFSVNSKLGKIVQKVYSDRPKCIVSFISDDLYIEDYNKRDWFKALGCPYTIPVVCSRINGVGYPTLEQLLELQNDYGYEIASHTVNHVNLPSKSNEEIYKELKDSYDILNSNGLRCENFMVPYGHYNDIVLNYAARIYRSTRTSEEDYNRVGLDTTNIKSFWIDQYKNTDLAGQKARLDYAIENNCWIIYSMHTGMMEETEFTDMVQPLIEYINSKNIPIMTVSKALDYFQNPIEVSSITEGGVVKKYFRIDCEGKVHFDELNSLVEKSTLQETTIAEMTTSISNLNTQVEDLTLRLESLENGSSSGGVKVSSVKIDSVQAIGVNDTKQLTCKVYPTTATNKNVTWSADNDSIATITSSGVITGNSIGNVNVTVTTEDGNKTDTITIEVTGELVVPDDFILQTYSGTDENWSLDTTFNNHGPGYATSVFKISAPSNIEVTKFDSFERNMKEVNFPVINGMSTGKLLTSYHDNAIVYRNGYIYVEIQNNLLENVSVNSFKSYLTENPLKVMIRKNSVGKTYLYADDGSGLESVGLKGNYYVGVANLSTNTSVVPIETDTSTLPYIDYNGGNYVDLATEDFYTTNNNRLYIGIATSKLTANTLTGLNEYLKKAPFHWIKNIDL